MESRNTKSSFYRFEIIKISGEHISDVIALFLYEMNKQKRKVFHVSCFPVAKWAKDSLC